MNNQKLIRRRAEKNRRQFGSFDTNGLIISDFKTPVRTKINTELITQTTNSQGSQAEIPIFQPETITSKNDYLDTEVN